MQQYLLVDVVLGDVVEDEEDLVLDTFWWWLMLNFVLVRSLSENDQVKNKSWSEMTKEKNVYHGIYSNLS